MKYQHLTSEKRWQITALKSNSKTQKDIAKDLKVAPSTVCREVKRNSMNGRYLYEQAVEKAAIRRKNASRRKKKMTPKFVEKIEAKLYEKWSPEQIAGAFTKSGESISYESIYRHIWADKKNGGDLYKNLRRRGKKYNFRGAKTAGRGLIPNRVDIKDRPKIVEEKSRLGDWEADTIIGKDHDGVLLTLVDRKSKLTIISKMNGKHAAQVPGLVAKGFKRLPRKIRSFSITSDNGKEFSDHAKITKKLKIQCYFATPYHSWERGLNEHTNGLIRQYFPKKTSLSNLTTGEIQFVENQLNNRPRKVLEYRTPLEVFLSANCP